MPHPTEEAPLPFSSIHKDIYRNVKRASKQALFGKKKFFLPKYSIFLIKNTEPSLSLSQEALDQEILSNQLNINTASRLIQETRFQKRRLFKKEGK
jgi:hypothetical protein